MSSPCVSSIIGTGSYMPEKILTNEDLSKIVDTSDEWITTRTGIKERRIAADNQATSDLATEAARRAMESAGVKPLSAETSVLLPAPLRPRRAWISPGMTVKSTPRNARVEPKVLVIPRISTMGFVLSMTFGSVLAMEVRITSRAGWPRGPSSRRSPT